MPVISRKFADELTEKEMRDAYLDAQTRTKLALQIRTLRAQRGLLQAQVGDLMGKPQSNVARLEDPEVARYTLSTLLELAAAYDVGLVVEFVPYEEFLRRTNDLQPAKLQVRSFNRSVLDPLCQEITAVSTPVGFISSVAPNVIRHHIILSNMPAISHKDLIVVMNDATTNKILNINDEMTVTASRIFTHDIVTPGRRSPETMEISNVR
jgi:transcriptional regulator with XRE-family HTH domain